MADPNYWLSESSSCRPMISATLPLKAADTRTKGPELKQATPAIADTQKKTGPSGWRSFIFVPLETCGLTRQRNRPRRITLAPDQSNRATRLTKFREARTVRAETSPSTPAGIGDRQEQHSRGARPCCRRLLAPAYWLTPWSLSAVAARIPAPRAMPPKM